MCPQNHARSRKPNNRLTRPVPAAWLQEKRLTRDSPGVELESGKLFQPASGLPVFWAPSEVSALCLTWLR